MVHIRPERFVLVLLLALLLAGCGSPEEETPTPVEIFETATPTAAAEPPTEPVYGLANVDSVEVLILESFPVQIHVSAQGFLPDSCTQIDDIIVQQEGQLFGVAMTTVREPEQVCAQALVPFEESIPLDVLGLPAGTYTVAVNGVEGSFTLDIDNVIQEEAPPPTAEPAPTAEPLASISGQVWHDLCAAPAPGAEIEDAETDPRCVTAGGALQANGLPDNEPGIEGVQVALGQGPCPAAGLGEAITDTGRRLCFR